MTSVRAFTLSLGPDRETSAPQDLYVRLGDQVEVRGAKVVGDIVLPKYTGYSNLGSLANLSGTSSQVIPLPIGTETSQRFVSDDIEVNPTVSALILPFAAMYRIRLEASYRWSTTPPDARVQISTFLGLTETQRISRSINQGGLGTVGVTTKVVFDQIVNCEIVAVSPLETTGSATDVKYILGVTYLGNL